MTPKTVAIGAALAGGEPAVALAAPDKPALATSVQIGCLEAENDRLRQERDRLLGLVKATQKLLEDQSRQRKPKRSWWRLGGDE